MHKKIKVLKNNYLHILFDLDQTLWDFKKNSLDVINKLFLELELEKHGIKNIDSFIEIYKPVNDVLWANYRAGKIDKLELNRNRFINTLKEFCDVSELLGTRMADLYIKYSPENVTLFPDAEIILEYLSAKYELHIITNGFREIQIPKLKSSGLEKYFKEFVFSEDAGCLKPDKRFFEYFINRVGAKKEECIVIGDDPESDILGAANAGIKQIWLNQNTNKIPLKVKATYTIKSLKEIRDIL